MSTRRTKPTFIAIKGQFEVEGLQPDGDSLRFRPDNPQLLLRLGKYPKGKAAATLLKTQRVQLRLEAIDTLETHYREFGASHQPINFYTANTQRMSILSGGNVGIGLAAPVQLLDINGNTNISSNYWYGINNARVLSQTALVLKAEGSDFFLNFT